MHKDSDTSLTSFTPRIAVITVLTSVLVVVEEILQNTCEAVPHI